MVIRVDKVIIVIVISLDDSGACRIITTGKSLSTTVAGWKEKRWEGSSWYADQVSSSPWSHRSIWILDFVFIKCSVESINKAMVIDNIRKLDMERLQLDITGDNQKSGLT